MAVIASGDDFEPLLSDDRVGKITGLLRLAYPQLPYDIEVFSFVVPPQKTIREDGEEVEIPAQAVFAVKSPHPRRGFDKFYANQDLMSSTATWLNVWQNEERTRLHYVSATEDPAFGPFSIAVRNHLRSTKSLKELI